MAEPPTGTSIPVQLIVLPDIVKAEPDGADKRVSEVNPLGTVSNKNSGSRIVSNQDINR